MYVFSLKLEVGAIRKYIPKYYQYTLKPLTTGLLLNGFFNRKTLQLQQPQKQTQ